MKGLGGKRATQRTTMVAFKAATEAASSLMSDDGEHTCGARESFAVLKRGSLEE